MQMIKWAPAVFLFCTSIFSHAQDFRGGLVAGINGAQVTGDEMGGFHQAGLYLGGSISRKFSERWLLYMELAYSGKGSRSITDDNNTSMGHWKTGRFHYMDLPLTIEYKPFKNHRLGFIAGPSFGYLFAGKIIYDDGSEQETSDILKPFELALHGGISYQKMDNWRFFARYCHSFLSITKGNSNIIYSKNPGYLNEILTLGMTRFF